MKRLGAGKKTREREGGEKKNRRRAGRERSNTEERRGGKRGKREGGGRREVADTGFLPYNYFGLYFWFIYFTRAHKPVVFARGKGSLRQGGGGRSPRGKSTTKMNRI